MGGSGIAAGLGWRWAMVVAAVAVLPFLLTDVPPLVDLPGHMGRYAVQASAPDDPVRGYFGFRWGFALNLGADVLIALLLPIVGLFAAAWIVAAAVPAITVLGVFAVARTLNPRGAAGLPWALIYVFNWPFFWGFLNFALAAGLSLLAFALWVRLADRARLRAALFVAVVPVLLAAHAVGGTLLVLLAGGYELARWQRPARALLPLAAGFAAALALWALVGAHAPGRTMWIAARKGEGLLTAVRDQNIVLDLGTVALTLAVLGLGIAWRARYARGAIGVLLALAITFVAMPSIIGGADRTDTRLAPYLFLVAAVLQDWSAVSPARRRWVWRIGAALLALRFVVMTAAFAEYDRAWNSERSALAHVPRGSRIVNLTLAECRLSGWRTHRLEHVSNLATATHGAWVNSHWTMSGVNLLQVRYRPGSYWADPSELIWPRACVKLWKPFARRDRHMLGEALAHLPYDAIDYVWLTAVTMPPGAAHPRLVRVWTNGTSELYRVRPVPKPAPAP
jgi:hypothetical protein